MPEGIEDNYVDELFLKGMAHKNSFPDLHYPVMIKSTVEVVHVINSVFLQIVLFSLMMNSPKESETENVLFYITIPLCIVGYIIYSLFRMNMEEEHKNAQTGVKVKAGKWANIMKIVFGTEFINNIKLVMFLSMILIMITPVMGSLTATYANDTIILNYASKFFKLLIILYFYH